MTEKRLKFLCMCVRLAMTSKDDSHSELLALPEARDGNFIVGIIAADVRLPWHRPDRCLRTIFGWDIRFLES